MTGFVGEVRMFAATFVPADWVSCEGQLLPISMYPDLYAIIGTTFGGDGLATFAVPDLGARTPLGVGSGPGLTPRVLGERGGAETVTLTVDQIPAHQHSVRASGAQATVTAPAGNLWAVAPDAAPYAAPQGSATLAPTGPAGGGAAHENRSPVVALHFGLCVEGVSPSFGDDDDTTLGEIRLWAGTTPPTGWLVCDGSSLQIASNPALFSILGTTYGGNGVTTFQLPDLRGRVPVHAGGAIVPGATGGAEEVTLTTAELPQHTHPAYGTSASATSSSPVGATWAAADRPQYAPTAQVTAAPTRASGGSRAHPNMPPYLGLSFVIAASGVYPSQD